MAFQIFPAALKPRVPNWRPRLTMPTRTPAGALRPAFESDSPTPRKNPGMLARLARLVAARRRALRENGRALFAPAGEVWAERAPLPKLGRVDGRLALRFARRLRW
jgi:hypothetical protein